MTARIEYREVTCKSALNRVDGMVFRWSVNPYRGCVHGCHYCFARRYHAYFDLNADEDFTGTVFVKTNIAPVLREELWLPKWRRELVNIGTATDPYQPIEGKYRLTRQCLQALADRRNPTGLVTKGPMVIRDIDVLSTITREAGCTVCVSITTLDQDLARKLEPTTAPPRKRLLAVSELAKAGVRVGVLLAPVVPGITDAEENVQAVAEGAGAHGAEFLGGRTLYLKAGTREHFMRFVEHEFPGLVPRYGELYRHEHAPRHFQQAMDARIQRARAAHGLAERDRQAIEPSRPRQLQLAL